MRKTTVNEPVMKKNNNNDDIDRCCSLNELCDIVENMKISDDEKKCTGKLSPTSVVSLSPLSNNNQISSLYSVKKRSLTLTDLNEDFDFVHLADNNSNVSEEFRGLIKAADNALKVGMEPVLCDDALGGTYFLRTDQEENCYCLVAKPGNEECNLPLHKTQVQRKQSNNNKASYGFYKGRIVPGFSMFREVAAYILDSKHAGVPETTIGSIRIKLSEGVFGSEASLVSVGTSWSTHVYKLCSLQKFIRHECSAEDLGCRMFAINDVHRIAILDIRLCNQDRHEGNILVVRSSQQDEERSPVSSQRAPKECLDLAKKSQSQFQLVPIDHGYALPHCLAMNEANFCWMRWAQTLEPLSATLKDYIKNLDYEKDVLALKAVINCSIPESSLITLQVCTMLLQKGVENDLSLFDIGMLMISDNITDTSPLQEAVNAAITECYNDQIKPKSYPDIFKMDSDNIKINDTSITTPCDDLLACVISNDSITYYLLQAVEKLVTSAKC